MPQRSEREPPKILVVDDDEETREFLVELLRWRGYSAVCVPDGEKAWSLLNAEGNYRLIITDLNMPVMDGLKLLERIRDRCLSVEVILWTGYLETDVTTRAETLKAFAVVTKGMLAKLLKNVELALATRVGGEWKQGEEKDL